MKEKELFCSFCGKPKELANRLIAGPNGGYICDECIEICKEVLNEEKVKRGDPVEVVKLMKPAYDKIGELAGKDEMKKLLDAVEANRAK